MTHPYYRNKYYIVLVEDDELSHIVEVFDNIGQLVEASGQSKKTIRSIIKRFYAKKQTIYHYKDKKCRIEFVEVEDEL